MSEIVRTPVTAPLNTWLKTANPQALKEYNSLVPAPATRTHNTFIAFQLKLPSSFEGRKVWSRWMSPIKNQGECGGCYSFASVSALADCFNIQSLGQYQLNLSAARIILCNLQNTETTTSLVPSTRTASVSRVFARYGCSGNTLSEAWRDLYTVGTTTEKCVPDELIFTSETCEHITSKSFDECEDGTGSKFYRPFLIVAVQGVDQMMKQIFKFGPITTVMTVYSDFYNIGSGDQRIYFPKTNIIVGGHAIVIDGWGEYKGVPFWWVRNSWGPQWGDKGYFKLLRGSNIGECETNAIMGIPDFHGHYVGALTIPNTLPFETQNRRIITSSYQPSGGLNTETGYSRRFLSYQTNLDKIASDPPVVVGPDLDKFVAGEHTASEHGEYKWLWLVLVVLLLIIINGVYHHTRST